MRPSWDDVWMKTAKTLAERSYDPRHKVGAVVVTSDNTQVLSIGNNGNAAGCENVPHSVAPGCSELIHAEINALLKMDYNNPKDKIMYLTLMPCLMCSKAIVNAGIKKVVYKNDYRDTRGIELLKRCEIKVIKIN